MSPILGTLEWSSHAVGYHLRVLGHRGVGSTSDYQLHRIMEELFLENSYSSSIILIHKINNISFSFVNFVNMTKCLRFLLILMYVVNFNIELLNIYQLKIINAGKIPYFHKCILLYTRSFQESKNSRPQVPVLRKER